MAKIHDLKTAKSNLIKLSPFIGSFIFSLKMEIDNSATNPTACTDGKKILFNENFIQPLTYQELTTLLAHEVCHVAFAHHFRLRGKDAQLWNVATDYAINLLLDAMGFTHLSNWLFDTKYKGMSAENIYKILQGQSKEQQDKQKQKSNSSGGSFEEPKDENGNDKSDTELDEAKQEAKEKLQQAKANMKKAMDSIDQSESMSESDKRELRKEYGKGFSELISEIEFESDSRMDWREVLNRFLSSIACNDFSLQAPDRRFISGSDFLMPSLYSNEVGNVFFALDVSGSCAQDAKRLVTEAKECLEGMEGADNSVMKICYCSDRIHSIDTIEDASQIKLVYGGGTDFIPAINAFSKDEDSECLIYITDGYCWSFGSDPERPVLWVLTRRNDSFKPPFGEVVLMD